jgi:transposase
MDEIIKLLDKNLDYVSHEIREDVMYITVKSNKAEVACPFCGGASSKVHSAYRRTIQDLPIQGKKVVLIINNRKMFCKNPECNHTTFAETFPFLPKKSKKTERLKEEILRLSLNCSSVAAAELLSQSVVSIGKSAICRYIKKQRSDL